MNIKEIEVKISALIELKKEEIEKILTERQKVNDATAAAAGVNPAPARLNVPELQEIEDRYNKPMMFLKEELRKAKLDLMAEELPKSIDKIEALEEKRDKAFSALNKIEAEIVDLKQQHDHTERLIASRDRDRLRFRPLAHRLSDSQISPREYQRIYTQIVGA